MKAIAFEGLGQGRNGPIAKAFFGYDIKVYAHTDHLTLRPGEPIILLGHSLGGETALKFAQPGDIVITMDPRPNCIGSWFDSILRYEMPFTAPDGVKVFNFYRRGLICPGQRVIGGENVNLPATLGHMAIPFQQEVRDKFLEFYRP